MTRILQGFALFCTSLLAFVAPAAPVSLMPHQDTEKKELSMETLRDKIRGGWAGQMIGVSYGAATEFQARGTTYSQDFKAEPIENAITQDDLYVEMTFAKVMDDIGINAQVTDYGKAFKDVKYNLWHANAAAVRNLNRGIEPPMTGHPKYNAHADDIDFQIESDFIGLMCPGLPQTSNKICNRVGHVMNYGDGVYGGMFVAGMYTAAFFESDPEVIVRAGLAALPARSKYAEIITDVLDAWRADPNDWEKTWEFISHKWDRTDLCPDGALTDLNIDAKFNGAFIAIGLLFGKGDVDRTLEITTRCGQDSDCNPSNAMGILGTVLGYNALPAAMREQIESIRDKKFSFTDYSFDDICTSTEKRAVIAVKAAGGSLDESGTTLTVNVQRPVAARLEQWRPGRPVKLLPFGGPAWKHDENWVLDQATSLTVANKPGATAEVTFTGTGIVICGHQTTKGGRADIFIDGKKQEQFMETWTPANAYDVDMWRAWDLGPGEHILRIVVRPDANEHSEGHDIVPFRAVIYNNE